MLCDAPLGLCSYTVKRVMDQLTDLLMQDWLYDEGEDATRSTYVAKMDEIRFVAGPIVGRYLDKVEEERQAALKVEEEKAAKKRAELEAKKKAEDESKKTADSKPPKPSTPTDTSASATEDTEMKDAAAEATKPDSVEEAGDDSGK